MFEKLNQIKDMYAMKKQADALKKQMEAILTTVEHKTYKLVMRGDQTVHSVIENGEEKKDLVELFNKAVKESQKTVAKKMKNQLGDFGFPGL